MIPNTFTYERAESLAHAMALLQGDAQAKLLAGGHSLIPLMKMRLTTPSKLVDISGLADLQGIKMDAHSVVVGALTTHRQVATSDIVQTKLPALTEAASVIGDLQVRNRGTVGGNLAHADPASDLPAIALAYDAVFTMIGPTGADTLAAEDFLLGPLLTALPENHLIVSVSFRIPPAGAKSTYLKYPHPASGYAVVGVAAVIRLDAFQQIDYARIAITGAGDVAYRARAVEEALIGKPLSDEVIAAASEWATEDVTIAGDLFASEAYRKQMCVVYTARALKRLL